MTIEITVDNAQVKNLLNRLSAQINDMTPAMRDIGEIVTTSIERNFAAEGRPVRWEKSKRAKIQGGQTLSDKGRLRRSFTNPAAIKAFADRVEVGTNVEYAPYLQQGTRPYTILPRNKKMLFWKGAAHPVKKVNHPGLVARPFLLVQDEDWGKIQRAILKYLVEGNA